MINMSAFYTSKNAEDFAEFFESRDDIIASVCTILTLIFIILFIVYGYVLINNNQGNLKDPEVQR